MKITNADPRDPRVVAMVAELDELMAGMYPAESNYLTDPESLVNGANSFFVAEIGEELLGMGALVKYDGYGEVKLFDQNGVLLARKSKVGKGMIFLGLHSD